MGWDDTFVEFPQIETSRLRLRELNVQDATRLYHYLSKKNVVEHYDIEALTSYQEAVDIIENLFFRYQSRRQIRWGITLKGEEELIGTCGFHSLDEQHLKVEIGYDLDSEYWGKGYMTEAVGKVVEYGFNEMELNRIEAFYFPLNYASKRVLEKNGFIEEGLLRKRFYSKDKYMDAFICSILKEDRRGGL
ncbi:GNAT family N-acetyltransferase [Robertmurraya massiliosenegalensis]|uniref:GNAT family N-acetyltransferase n=1 Tax=Robertmurraya massiliosenegalensis TaxID=1287657 RepID=UPI0002D339AA|nr:GNAT family protein [Robertmurraya massiliosenegalensis]